MSQGSLKMLQQKNSKDVVTIVEDVATGNAADRTCTASGITDLDPQQLA